jgi:hypothetical protein
LANNLSTTPKRSLENPQLFTHSDKTVLKLVIVIFPAAPHTEVTGKGDIEYSEVVRENVRKLEAYVKEMASGDTVSGAVNI